MKLKEACVEGEEAKTPRKFNISSSPLPLPPPHLRLDLTSRIRMVRRGIRINMYVGKVGKVGKVGNRKVRRQVSTYGGSAHVEYRLNTHTHCHRSNIHAVFRCFSAVSYACSVCSLRLDLRFRLRLMVWIRNRNSTLQKICVCVVSLLAVVGMFVASIGSMFLCFSVQL